MNTGNETGWPNTKAEAMRIIEREFEEWGYRMDMQPPVMTVERCLKWFGVA